MDYTSIRVGQLQTDVISGSDFIPHEVAGILKKATITDLAAFIGATDAVGFRAVTVENGGTLPDTDTQEFILVGPGSYNNVGGGSVVTVTEELNALVSNGTFWFVGVEISIDAPPGNAIWGEIIGTLSNQTDLMSFLALKADLVDGKVPSSQLPSYVDDVIEVANFAALPVTGETGKIYITLDTGFLYRWSGSIYIRISNEAASWGTIVGTLSNQTDLQTALNAKEPTITAGTTSQYFRGDKTFQTLNKAAVGLSNVDNTSDLNKPISTATQTALDAKFDDPTGDTTQYIDGTGALQTFPVLASADKLILVVRNTSGATITKGTVVYINGASGNKPTIAKALATGDSTSAQTLGLVQANIANNSNGNVVLVGSIIDLNTSAFTDGQQLYLSGVTAGTYTATKTLAPTHLVYVGVVARSHPTQGVIEVKIQNGYELEELHDVAISSLVNNEFLVYESASDLWKNKSLGTVLGGISTQFVKGNGSLDSNVYALDNVVVKLTGNQTIGGIKTFFNDFIVNDINIGRGGSNVASNTVFGAVAGFSNTTGDDNSFFGYQAGYLNTSGQGNTFLGRDAGQKNTSGNANSFFGFYAAGENTSGGNNVSFGYSAGRFIANGSTVNGISNESIFLGAQSKALASNQSNQIVIGYAAIGNGSNSVTLGNDSITKTILKGSVGIGTTSPNNLLTLNSSGAAGNSTSIGLFSTFNEATNRNWSIGLNLHAYGDFAIRTSSTQNGNPDTTRFLINPSGNVGIGTTSPQSLLQLTATTPFLTIDNQSATTLSGIKWATNGTTLEASIEQQRNTAEFRISSGRSAGWGGFQTFYTDTTEKMRITSSGNVGIGTTSPNVFDSTANKLVVGSGIASEGITIYAGASSNSSIVFSNGTTGVDLYRGFIQYNHSNNSMTFNNNGGSERMRITSGGAVLVGTTTAVGSGSNTTPSATLNNGYNWFAITDSNYFQRCNNTDGALLNFLRGGTAVGSITVTSSATFYNVTSDYRLKEDFKNYSGLNLISKIKTYDYKWKSSEDRMYGVKAHELQEVLPYAVTGQKDAKEMQSVDYSKLVPILVQAIQELKAEIEILKNK